MIFYTSDTHFGHRNIIEYCDRRFFRYGDLLDVEFMDKTMIRLWNERVTPKDIVYHLGDFAFYNQLRLREIAGQLKGQKILIRGNHDRRITNAQFYRAGFSRVTLEDWVQEGNELFYLHHQPEENWKAKRAPDLRTPTRHFCGHIHIDWARQGDIINVGVDQSWFMPLTAEELLNRD